MHMNSTLCTGHNFAERLSHLIPFNGDAAWCNNEYEARRFLLKSDSSKALRPETTYVKVARRSNCR